jgi:PAS domain S-box-containing protein
LPLPSATDPDSLEESRHPSSDLSERRPAAERSLRASEERYRGLAEQLVDGIFVVDVRGHYLDANDAGCQMLGYTLAQLKTLTVEDVVAAAELPKLALQFQRLATGEIVRNEWCFRRKDGTTFPGELVARQLPDGRLQGVVRDLTEQKRSANALLRRLDFERFLFELSRTFIGLPEAEVDVNMKRGLAQVGEFLDMDRVTLLEVSRDRTEMTAAYWWTASAAAGAPPVVTQRALPWWVNQVLRGEVSLASRVDDLPEEAAAEKAYFRQRGIASAASIPLKVGGEIAGAIAFATTQRHVTWTEALVSQLRAIGDILWNALKRREAMQALLAAQREGEVLRRLRKLAKLPLEANVEDLLMAIVDMAIDVAHADFGNIQLLDPKTSELHIKAQRGFPRWWIEHWEAVTEGRGTCGTTLKRHERVIVEDVERSPIFTAAELDVHRRAGVRAVQSTPLVSRSGQLIGIFSTHFKRPGRPDPHTLFLLDLLAREAADIIGYVQAEAELKRRAALLDLAHDSIFVRDREGHILYWNDGATRCYGWSKEEALGKVSHTLLMTQFPEPLEHIFDVMARTGFWEGELVHTRRDGRRITVDSRWAIQPGADAGTFRILEICTDITERKMRERERAEEVRRKDEFLAFLGHELRNPLAAISTAIQVLSRGVPPAQRDRMEQIIRRQTGMMRRLVDDLLELERISHGHIELQASRVDLAECLHRAAAAVQSTIDGREQALALQLPSEPVAFMADGTRLDQIVGNLLTNASKYTPRGGRIELTGAVEGGGVIIRCRDNGQGISVEHQPKIFEMFARGSKTELGYGEASVGLGLALVKQLTELHGGSVSVSSGGAGLGSEFTVRLPLMSPPSSEAPTPVGGVSARRRSIVIVEDNPTVGEVLQTALEVAGHSVHLFADGPSALAGVSTLTPDVLLVDIGLPGMDGYELASTLKQHPNTKDALFIAVSGFKRRDQTEARDAFAHYLTKPIDIAALLELLA